MDVLRRSSRERLHDLYLLKSTNAKRQISVFNIGDCGHDVCRPMDLVRKSDFEFHGYSIRIPTRPRGQSRFNPADMSSRTFQNMPQEFTWQAYFNKLAPQPGDTAPDFELYDITGTEVVKLSDFRGRQPVALIFGSFT